jgi:hypothetical protein
MKHITENIVAEITKAVTAIKGCRFASLTYLGTKSNELARYTVNFGFSYHQAVEKSKLELELLMQENKDTWTPLEHEAAAEQMASLNETLAAHARGEQNKNYTKKGQYIPLGGGANLNTKDNTIQMFGLVLTKVTLVEGVYPKVNSAPLTIAKAKLRKRLAIGNFREFAIDEGRVAQMKVNGDVIEIPEMASASV